MLFSIYPQFLTCIIHIGFDSSVVSALGGKERVSFASDGASVSVEHNGRSRWWRIESPASHVNRTTSIWDHDDTVSWLICSIHSDCRKKHGMVFVPIAEKQSKQISARGTWMISQNVDG
jgi:hypothetical protein